MRVPFHRMFGRKAGYTLIEALAVILIVVIITTIVAASYPILRDQQRILRAATEAQSAIREAQQYALAGTTISGTSSKGYGVHFANGSNSYVVFADKDGSNTYNAGDVAINGTRNFSSLNSLVTGNCPAYGGQTLDIVFTPPTPTITITGSASCTAACISFFASPSTYSEVSIAQNSGIITTASHPIAQLFTGPCP